MLFVVAFCDEEWGLGRGEKGGRLVPCRAPLLCDLMLCVHCFWGWWQVVVVALEGLDNILKHGNMSGETGLNDGGNEYAQIMEENNAVELLDKLQSNDHKGVCRTNCSPSLPASPPQYRCSFPSYSPPLL